MPTLARASRAAAFGRCRRTSRLHSQVDVYVKCQSRTWKAADERARSQLDYPFGDDPARARHGASKSRPACAGCAWACPSRSTTSTSGCCATASTASRQGWSIVDCGIGDDGDARRRGSRSSRPSSAGLPVLRVIVTHMHPDHIGLAALAVRALERAPVDQRHRLRRRPHWRAAPAPASAATLSAADFMARHGLAADPEAVSQVARAHQLLQRAWCPRCRRRYRAPARRRRAGHRPARAAPGAATPATATRPSTWRCTARSARRADQRRHGAAAHLHQRQRHRRRARGGPADALPRLDRAHALACPSDVLVLPSHGRPFKGLHTRIDQLQAHHAERFAEVLEACATRPRRRPSSSCRCSSSASSTCTR